jgi:HIV Tat-specific factor 1
MGLFISKLADWDDEEVSALPDTSSRFDKVVVLKHMFTLEEIEVRIYDDKSTGDRN